MQEVHALHTRHEVSSECLLAYARFPSGAVDTLTKADARNLAHSEGQVDEKPGFLLRGGARPWGDESGQRNGGEPCGPPPFRC